MESGVKILTVPQQEYMSLLVELVNRSEVLFVTPTDPLWLLSMICTRKIQSKLNTLEPNTRSGFSKIYSMESMTWTEKYSSMEPSSTKILFQLSLSKTPCGR